MTALVRSCRTLWLTMFGLYTLAAVVADQQLPIEHMATDNNNNNNNDDNNNNNNRLINYHQHFPLQSQASPYRVLQPDAVAIMIGDKPKKSWQKLHGGWGKRSDLDGIEYADPMTIGGRPYEAVDAADFERASNAMLATYFDDIDEQNEKQQQPDELMMAAAAAAAVQPAKRAWKSMNGGWGKRLGGAKREPGWNNLKGLWGKRGDWNKLQSAWGKRDAMHDAAEQTALVQPLAQSLY